MQLAGTGVPDNRHHGKPSGDVEEPIFGGGKALESGKSTKRIVRRVAKGKKGRYGNEVSEAIPEGGVSNAERGRELRETVVLHNTV